MVNKNILGHSMILFAIFIWGTTFVSSKVLIGYLSPMEIAIYRFFIAYIIMAAMTFGKRMKFSIKEEITFMLLGLSGITFYFLFENNALLYTTASNASLIISCAPLLTAILAHFLLKDEKMTKNIVIGFFFALIGLVLIIFNGKFILKLNPLGDFLAFSAALTWGIYSIQVKKLKTNYSYLIINRKVFFYGLITSIPFSPVLPKAQVFTNPVILFNLLFLGLIASALCYILWFKAVEYIGVIKTNNYIYFSPLVTVIFSVLILNEKLTALMVSGAVFLLIGIYISQMKGFSFFRTGKNK